VRTLVELAIALKRGGEDSPVCEDGTVTKDERKRITQIVGQLEGEPGKPRRPWLVCRLIKFQPERLRELMDRDGIENPNQLAVQGGFGKDDPGRWLKGTEPSIQNLFQLAMFFHVSPVYFYSLPEMYSKPKLATWQAEAESPVAMCIDLVRHALGPQHAEILEAFSKANGAGKKMVLAAARSLTH
jgi:hypothetical protein